MGGWGGCLWGVLMKVRQAEPPPGLSAVRQCLWQEADQRELRGSAWEVGGCQRRRRFKGCVCSGLVWSDVNGLLLGRQQAVHSCRHGLHVDLWQDTQRTNAKLAGIVVTARNFFLGRKAEADIHPSASVTDVTVVFALSLNSFDASYVHTHTYMYM